MKNLNAVTAALILTLTLAGMSKAQTPTKKSFLPTLPPVPSQIKPNWGKLKGGTVLSVNATAGTVNIQAKDGTQATYTITKTTRLHRNRKPAKTSDIVAGDHVMLARFNSATKEAAQLELFARTSGLKAVPTPNTIPHK